MSWFVVAVVGASLVVLALIVWPVSRRVRAETGMDPDLAAALLLGEDVDDTDGDDEESEPHYRDFDPGEIRALQEIGEPEPTPKRRRSKKR